MMGRNEFKFNKATIMEAVRFWMQEKVLQKGVTFSVTDFDKDPNSYAAQVYNVTIETPEATAPATETTHG